MVKRCEDCGTILGDNRSKRCRACAGKFKSGRNYAKCEICGKVLSNYNGRRCRKCFSNSRLNHVVSQNTREKISNSLKGRKVTEETKAKLRIASTGKKATKIARQKMSQAAKKREQNIRTDEHIRNLHQANLNNGTYHKTGVIRSHGKYDYIKIAHLNGQRNWQPLHRYLIEKQLGRELNRNEHIHHIDGNTHNNDLSNLVLLSGAQHHTINHVITKLNADTDGKFAYALLATLKHRFPGIYETIS